MLDQQNAQVDKIEDQVSSSSSSQDSDYSFNLENKDFNRSHLQFPTDEKNEHDKKRKSKFGLKYAKISFRQRLGFIERVTSTGCTIKKAAKEFSINVSTAKAIMKTFKKEGRITNKNSIEVKKKPIKNSDQIGEEIIQRQSQFEVKNQDIVQSEEIKNNNEMNLYQQALESNRYQALIIQQLNTQNNYLQNRINEIQQEKQQINYKYELLVTQYYQLQQMVQQPFQPFMYQYVTFNQ